VTDLGSVQCRQFYVYVHRLPYLAVEYSATIPVYISLLTLFVVTNFGLSTFMDPGAYPKGR